MSVRIPTRQDPFSLEHYQGLVRTTAARYEPFIEEDYDEIVQILLVKVWRSLDSYDPERSRLPVRNYVFACVKNQCKDLVKKKRRNTLSIDELTAAPAAGEQFQARYLAAPDDLLEQIEPEPEGADLPSTLTAQERQVALLLIDDYRVSEIALRMAVKRPQVSALVGSIQVKMSDWRPTPQAERAVEMAAA